MNFLHVITCLLLAAVPPVGDGGTGESDIEIQTMCLNNETFNLPLDSFGIDGNGRLLALSCVAMLLVTALFLYKAERTVVNKLKSDFVKMWQMKGEADVKMNELSASLDKTQNTLSSTQRKLSDAESKHAVQSKQMKQEINQLKQKNISLQAQYDSEKKRADLTENSCKRAQKAMTEMENKLRSTQRLKEKAEAKANELSSSLDQTKNTLSSAERKIRDTESIHASQNMKMKQEINQLKQKNISLQAQYDSEKKRADLTENACKRAQKAMTEMEIKLLSAQRLKENAEAKANELSTSLDQTQNTLSSAERKIRDTESMHAAQNKTVIQKINELEQKNNSLQAQYDSEKKRADLTENACERAQKAMTEMENNLLSTQRLKDNAEAKANELSASLNQTQNTLSSAERKLEEMESRHAAREANWLQTIYDFAQELVSTQSKADEQVAKMTLELRDSKVDSEELTKMKTKLEAEKKRKKKTQKKMNRMLKEHLRTQGQKEKAEVKVRELTTALIKSQIKLSYKQRRQCAISQMKDTENQLTEVQTPLLEAKDSALATESQQVAVENDIKMKLEIKEPVKSVKRKNRKKLVPYDIYKLNKEESNLIQCWWELSN